jgi:hypothetical protein
MSFGVESKDDRMFGQYEKGNDWEEAEELADDADDEDNEKIKPILRRACIELGWGLNRGCNN